MRQKDVCIVGWEMFVFRKIWRALFSWSTRFEIDPFAFLPVIEFVNINVLDN